MVLRQDKDGFAYRSWMKNQGLPHHVFDGPPVIGICNTWSELTPCNAHLREIAERVKRGVYEMGSFPVEFLAMLLGKTLLRPTAMLFRNLASMDLEESIRGNPLDAVVLCPEAGIGGPIALVKNGDMITLDVAVRSLSIDLVGASGSTVTRDSH